MALMGKWGWRALQGCNELWQEVAVDKEVRVRKGMSGFNLLKPEGKVRGWWGDVVESIKDSKGDWFVSSIRRRVGKGDRTSFLNDAWVGESPLRILYPKLFDLYLDKDCSVRGAGEWEEEGWRWGNGWRRDLRVWETDSLNELSLLLVCRKDASEESDRWCWTPEACGDYSVRSSYKILADRKKTSEPPTLSWSKPLWRCWAIPKAKTVAWRVLVGRIATKVELVKRGVLQANGAIACPLCGDGVESINHLFFECIRSWELWARCLDWLGLQVVLPGSPDVSFAVFCQLGSGKRVRNLLASIWICVVWSIWKIRNDIVFNNGNWDQDKIIEEIKSFVWSWGAGRDVCRDKTMRFRDWCAKPVIVALQKD